MIKESTEAIGVYPDNLPEALTRRRQWVNWRLEERAEKPTKIPYTPETGRWASTSDLMTWRPFEDVMTTLDTERYAALDLPRYDGIGFCFCSADPYVGIDLDDCRNPETGEIAPWAKKILEGVQEAYVEASPSGTGAHIIIEGTVRDGGRSRRKVHVGGEVVGEIEMYSRDRFFTITGLLL